MSTYKIDPTHSSANFSVRHMMIAKVHGSFQQLQGELFYDSQNPEALTVDVVIAANSVSTGDEKRDEHLRSADFFDVLKYPTLTFRSQKVVANKDELKISGELTIHGVTKAVTLEVEGPTAELKDPWGNMRIAASGRTKVNRKDFGLEWNAALEAGGVLVGEDVTITLDVQFVKQV